MQKRNLLTCSAACALMTAALSAPAYAQLDEVIVTATKKAGGESTQDIPLAVLAIDAESLKEQGITNFADYVQNLPNINAGGRGPGQNEIYIRGAAVDAINITVAESQGSAPNVALYLDEQPITAGGRNLDVYVSDMERIEVLPGPQGTLYGASSMAGTVRLITAKPKMNTFDASVGASYSFTAGGEDSNSVEAMINVPIIEDKLAIRIAAYSDRQGGYIDNVAGTFSAGSGLNPSHPGATHTIAGGTVLADGTVVAAGGQTYNVDYAVANNGNLVEEDFNDASYNGIRFGAKYIVNDDWDLLLQHSRQVLKTEGVFDYDPAKGDLNVSRFAPDSLDDSFHQTAWTVNGRMGMLDLVYTGAYLDRETESDVDYTGYTNIGGYIPGYQCEYLAAGYTNIAAITGTTNSYNFDPTISGNPDVIECGNPTNLVKISNTNARTTHEFRGSTNWDFPVNFLGGVYFEDFEITHVGNFNYAGSAEAGFPAFNIDDNSAFDNAAQSGTTQADQATQFRNDNLRTEKQTAFFGEANWDITDQFNIAIGARYYDLEYNFEGYGAFRYGNRPLTLPNNTAAAALVTPSTAPGGRDYSVNLGDLAPIKTDGVIMKYTGTYKPNDDVLLYTSWSEGYRPPGINRGAARSPYNASANNTYVDLGGNTVSCGPDRASAANAANGFPGYCLPYVFESDTMETIELGWKTNLMDGNVRFNGAIYKTDWKDIQVSHFDSQNISIFTLVDNGADAEIFGVEGDFAWSASDNLTITAAGSYNDTELTSIDTGLDFVVADAGSALPLTPKVQFSGVARYEWDTDFYSLQDMGAFWQLGGKYAGESVNSIVDTADEPQEDQDAYFLLDASAGLASNEDGWALEVFAKNLTDERAELHINRQDFIKRITTNRPRTMGIRMRQNF